MTPIYVHPIITRHPGRIQALERRTGMRVVAAGSRAQLVRGINPGQPPGNPTPPRAA